MVERFGGLRVLASINATNEKLLGFLDGLVPFLHPPPPGMTMNDVLAEVMIWVFSFECL